MWNGYIRWGGSNTKTYESVLRGSEGVKTSVNLSVRTFWMTPKHSAWNFIERWESIRLTMFIKFESMKCPNFRFLNKYGY